MKESPKEQISLDVALPTTEYDLKLKKKKGTDIENLMHLLLLLINLIYLVIIALFVKSRSLKRNDGKG